MQPPGASSHRSTHVQRSCLYLQHRALWRRERPAQRHRARRHTTAARERARARSCAQSAADTLLRCVRARGRAAAGAARCGVARCARAGRQHVCKVAGSGPLQGPATHCATCTASAAASSRAANSNRDAAHAAALSTAHKFIVPELWRRVVWRTALPARIAIGRARARARALALFRPATLPLSPFVAGHSQPSLARGASTAPPRRARLPAAPTDKCALRKCCPEHVQFRHARPPDASHPAHGTSRIRTLARACRCSMHSCHATHSHQRKPAPLSIRRPSRRARD